MSKGENKEQQYAESLLMQVFKYIGKEGDTLMYLYDLKNHVAYYNRVTAKMFNIPETVTDMPESIMKRDFLLPESQEEFIRLHHMIENDSLEAVGTLRLKTVNGINTIYELKLIRILNEDGTKSNGCLGRLKDVTERYIKAESHNQYLKIINGNSKIPFLYDKKKDVLKIYYPDEKTGQFKDRSFFFYSRMVKEEQICAKQDIGILLEFLNNGSDAGIQLEIFDQITEEYRWYSLTGHLGEENPNLINGVAEDITDMKAKGNNKERLTKLLNVLSEDYILIYEIDLVNDYFEALLGDFARLGFMVPVKGIYSMENSNISSKAHPDYIEKRAEFGSIENIRKSLKNKRKMVLEYKTMNEKYPWRLVMIQKLEWDSEGYPTKVLLSHILVEEQDLITLGNDTKGIGEKQTASSQEMSEPETSMLIVEDYELNAKLVIDNAAIVGFKADWAASKKEALEKINNSKEQYAMILIDDKLKDASGFDTSKEIRKIQKDTPIILCSLSDSKELDKKCEAAGINTHVSKPVVAKQIKYLKDKYL